MTTHESVNSGHSLRGLIEELSRKIDGIHDLVGGSAPVQPGYVLTNSIGMKLVGVPAGEFSMGTSAEEIAKLKKEVEEHATLPWVALWIQYLDNEGPGHHVRITEPFYMGAHEVTVGQFEQFVNETGYLTEGERNQETGVLSYGLDLTTGLVEPKPYYTWRFWLRENHERPSGFVQTPEHPVVCVSWNDANAFCEWLSQKEGRPYRLPTEAEWEYACRAGTTTRFSSGDDEKSLGSVGNIADKSLQVRWKMEVPGAGTMDAPPYAKGWDDRFPFTAPVGSFESNAWGLYDMHGNGGEWCMDWYAPYADFVPAGQVLENPLYDPGEPPPVDYTAVVPGSEPRALRVIRGGVWLDPAFGFRSADRETHRRHPVDSAADIGFRVVCSSVELNRLPLPGVSLSKKGAGRPLDDAGNFLLKIDSHQSGKKCFVFEGSLPGDHPGVPLHLHEEEFVILQVTDGEFMVEYGDPRDPHNRELDQRAKFGPGTIAVFPRMTPYGYRTASSDKKVRATALITVVPGGLENLYAEARGLPPEEFVRLGIEKYGMVTLGPPPEPEKKASRKKSE